jgi:hypothetical protein
MRDNSEVLEKFNEVRAVKLRERKQRYLCRAFMNCASNSRMRVKGKGQVGFCQNQVVLGMSKSGMFICNDDDTAKRCRVWSCRSTEESVEREFDDVLRSPARCGEEYPKLAMLIWFLQEFEMQGRWARLWYLVAKAAEHVWKVVSLRWW